MESLKISRITEEYEIEAQALVLQGMKERFGFIDKSYNPDLISIFKTYNTNEKIFLIGMIDNELVCTGALTKEDDYTARIQRVSVKKEYRRKGIANKMLQFLEQTSKENGYQRIVLETNTDWASAIKFYSSNQYKQVLNDGISITFSKSV